VLRHTPVNMVLLIALIVVIGILAVAGSRLWKRANRLGPASRRHRRGGHAARDRGRRGLEPAVGRAVRRRVRPGRGITGPDLVYWTKSGDVFHLCEDASAVNLESKDNTIYSGTVADAPTPAPTE